MNRCPYWTRTCPKTKFPCPVPTWRPERLPATFSVSSFLFPFHSFHNTGAFHDFQPRRGGLAVAWHSLRMAGGRRHLPDHAHHVGSAGPAGGDAAAAVP